MAGRPFLQNKFIPVTALFCVVLVIIVIELPPDWRFFVLPFFVLSILFVSLNMDDRKLKGEKIREKLLRTEWREAPVDHSVGWAPFEGCFRQSSTQSSPKLAPEPPPMPSDFTNSYPMPVPGRAHGPVPKVWLPRAGMNKDSADATPRSVRSLREHNVQQVAHQTDDEQCAARKGSVNESSQGKEIKPDNDKNNDGPPRRFKMAEWAPSEQTQDRDLTPAHLVLQQYENPAPGPRKLKMDKWAPSPSQQSSFTHHLQAPPLLPGGPGQGPHSKVLLDDDGKDPEQHVTTPPVNNASDKNTTTPANISGDEQKGTPARSPSGGQLAVPPYALESNIESDANFITSDASPSGSQDEAFALMPKDYPVEVSGTDQQPPSSEPPKGPRIRAESSPRMPPAPPAADEEQVQAEDQANEGGEFRLDRRSSDSSRRSNGRRKRRSSNSSNPILQTHQQAMQQDALQHGDDVQQVLDQAQKESNDPQPASTPAVPLMLPQVMATNAQQFNATVPAPEPLPLQPAVSNQTAHFGYPNQPSRQFTPSSDENVKMQPMPSPSADSSAHSAISFGQQRQQQQPQLVQLQGQQQQQPMPQFQQAYGASNDGGSCVGTPSHAPAVPQPIVLQPLQQIPMGGGMTLLMPQNASLPQQQGGTGTPLNNASMGTPINNASMMNNMQQQNMVNFPQPNMMGAMQPMAPVMPIASGASTPLTPSQQTPAFMPMQPFQPQQFQNVMPMQPFQPPPPPNKPTAENQAGQALNLARMMQLQTSMAQSSNPFNALNFGQSNNGSSSASGASTPRSSCESVKSIMNTPRSVKSSKSESLPQSNLAAAIQSRLTFDGREPASSVGNLSFGPAMSIASSRKSKRSHISAVTPRDLKGMLSQHRVDKFVGDVELEERARLLQAFQGDGIMADNPLWKTPEIRELVTTIVKTRGLIANSNAKVRLSQGQPLPEPKSQIPSLKMNAYKSKPSNKRKPQDVLLKDLLKLELKNTMKLWKKKQKLMDELLATEQEAEEQRKEAEISSSSDEEIIKKKKKKKTEQSEASGGKVYKKTKSSNKQSSSKPSEQLGSHIEPSDADDEADAEEIREVDEDAHALTEDQLRRAPESYCTVAECIKAIEQFPKHPELDLGHLAKDVLFRLVELQDGVPAQASKALLVLESCADWQTTRDILQDFVENPYNRVDVDITCYNYLLDQMAKSKDLPYFAAMEVLSEMGEGDITPPTVDSVVNVLRCLAPGKHYEHAMVVMNQCFTITNQKPDVRCYIYTIQACQDNAKQVQILFQHLVKARLTPDDSASFCKLSNVAGSNWGDLLTIFENMQIHDKPLDLNANYSMLCVLVANNRLPETLTLKSKLENEHGTSKLLAPRFYQQFFKILGATGSWEVATEMLQQQKELKSGKLTTIEPCIFIGTMEALSHAGKYEQALQVFKDLKKGKPTHFKIPKEVFHYLMKSYAQGGQDAAVMNVFRMMNDESVEEFF